MNHITPYIAFSYFFRLNDSFTSSTGQYPCRPNHTCVCVCVHIYIQTHEILYIYIYRVFTNEWRSFNS